MVGDLSSPLGAPPSSEALPKTILVAEDDWLVRTTLAEFLDALGFEVLTAEDGLEAMRLFQAHGAHIDLVLTDLVMPKLGGHDVLKGVQQIDPSMKVIVSSGYCDPSLLQDLRYNAFLQKPYGLASLKAALAECGLSS